jgi:hypothetical protein
MKSNLPDPHYQNLAEDIALCFSHGLDNQETIQQVCIVRENLEMTDLIGLIRYLLTEKDEENQND